MLPSPLLHKPVVHRALVEVDQGLILGFDLVEPLGIGTPFFRQSLVLLIGTPPAFSRRSECDVVLQVKVAQPEKGAVDVVLLLKVTDPSFYA